MASAEKILRRIERSKIRLQVLKVRKSPKSVVDSEMAMLEKLYGQLNQK